MNRNALTNQDIFFKQMSENRILIRGNISEIVAYDLPAVTGPKHGSILFNVHFELFYLHNPAPDGDGHHAQKIALVYPGYTGAETKDEESPAMFVFEPKEQVTYEEIYQSLLAESLFAHPSSGNVNFDALSFGLYKGVIYDASGIVHPSEHPPFDIDSLPDVNRKKK